MGKDKSLDEQILEIIKKQNLTVEEAKRALAQLSQPEKLRRSYEHFYDSKKVKLGVFSDPHFGSKFFDYQAFDHAVKTFNKEKVDAIYIPGDVIEGMSTRPGHVYELEHIGNTAQINHAAQMLGQFKQPIYFITGNHDEWAKKKSDQGTLVGPEIASRVKGSTFLGEYTADIKLNPNVTMRLTHEGATAYALSYSLQKRINALSGGTKPDILLNGHLHKMLYLYYRNIQAMECGTLLKQTPFMQMLGSPAHVGFTILDIGYNKKGVNSFSPTIYPHYE